MAGFTDSEVQDSINRFLLVEVKANRLSTGARDTVDLRSSVYDLLTTTLLLRPDAYFYTIYLAKNRLKALVSEQLSDLSRITDAGPNTTRQSKKINSTSELVNAKSATLELAAGLNSRSSGIQGSIGPAVDRFRRSISKFVNTELVKNTVDAGVVIETADELRAVVSTTWASAVDRHDQIQTLAENIAGALTALAAVKLPERAVRTIVSKIQDRLDELQSTLEGPTAIAESREAMLDLLVMRTLMTKASSFRSPETDLMPKTGDSITGAFIDSPGLEPSVVGLVSAPYNYDPGTVLSLSLNTASSLPVVALPGSSRAEVRSQPLSFPSGPTAPSEVAFYLDFAGVVSGDPHAGGAPLAPWATGTDAATKLDSILAGVSVTWDAATSQLVFQSESEADSSLLRTDASTADRLRFVSWAFGGLVEGRYRPITAATVAGVISRSASLAGTSVVDTVLAEFTGVRTSLIGEEARIWDRRDQGVDLVASGTTSVVSPSRNFSALVTPGMRLVVSLPYSAVFGIVEVNGDTLVLDAPATAGVLDYYIGPDYSGIPVGARVRTIGTDLSDNTGYYRVVVAGDGFIDMDRGFLGADSALSTVVFTSVLSVSSRGTTTTSGITALAGTGATALGLPTGPEQRASLSVFELSGSGDFVVRGVRVGDTLDLVSPGLITYTADISSVDPSRLALSNPVLYEPGAWTYAVRSSRAVQYEALQAGVSTYLNSTYALNFAALDRLMSRLINGARYAGAIEAGVLDYIADLEDMATTLDLYVVAREPTVDNAVNTLREQGFDRALDLFLTLGVKELFSMDADGVSYSTWVVRKAATAAREVVPVSKYAAGQNVIQDVRAVSFQPDPYDPAAKDDKSY